MFFFSVAFFVSLHRLFLYFFILIYDYYTTCGKKFREPYKLLFCDVFFLRSFIRPICSHICRDRVAKCTNMYGGVQCTIICVYRGVKVNRASGGLPGLCTALAKDLLLTICQQNAPSERLVYLYFVYLESAWIFSNFTDSSIS